MKSGRKLFPVYTSRGIVAAVLQYPHLYNRQGEWIGWVTQERAVYAVDGRYVGRLSEEFRILRRPSEDYSVPARRPPRPPGAIGLPSHFPLAPMMPVLPSNLVDVLEEQPDLLPPLDAANNRNDTN